MTGLLAALAAVLAWLGGGVLVLSDRRYGLALGLAASAVGLALAATIDGAPAAGLMVGVAGLAAAGLRLRDGDPGWGLLPAGSTPRIVLAVGAGVGSALMARMFAANPGAWALEVAVLCPAILGSACLLAGERRAVILAGASMLAQAAAGAGLIVKPGQLAGVAVAAAVGLAISLLPAGSPSREAPR